MIVDLVPNHSSSEHAWFQAALAAEPGQPRAGALHLPRRQGPRRRPSRRTTGSATSAGPAWTRVTEADGTPGQWYLHLFDVTQPDFDWTNPEVGDEMESVLRFWLDRGVDGFRIDVAHGLVKAEGLPDATVLRHELAGRTSDQPMWDQPGVHDIYRRWRKVTDSYAVEGQDADRILCAEAWVTPLESLALYVRPDELHQSFNFPFLVSPVDRPELRDDDHRVARGRRAVRRPADLGAVQPRRRAPRLAARASSRRPARSRWTASAPDDPQPDAELGLRRARAATTLMLALPGSAYLYQGEELGLPEATTLPDDAAPGPDVREARRGAHAAATAAGSRCRGRATRPAFGFGPHGEPWLPQPEVYGELAVDRQTGVAGLHAGALPRAPAPAPRAAPRAAAS